MEKELKECLRENEEIRWQGKRTPFPLLDEATKFPTLRKWILTVGLGGGILGLYFWRNAEPSVGFILIVAAIMGMLLVSPFAEKFNTERTQCWITNQRAILMTRDKTVYYMELSELDGFQVVKDMAANDCLVLGSCIFEDIRKQLRWRASHPKVNLTSSVSQGKAEGLVFYCINNADTAEELLRQAARAA